MPRPRLPLARPWHRVPTAVGDATEFLDLEVDQLAGVLALVTHDHPAGPVGVGQPAHAVAGQHPIDGRAGHGEVVAEPMGALAAAPPGGQHPPDLAGRQGMGQRWGRELRSASPAWPSLR